MCNPRTISNTNALNLCSNQAQAFTAIQPRFLEFHGNGPYPQDGRYGREDPKQNFLTPHPYSDAQIKQEYPHAVEALNRDELIRMM